MQSKQQKLFALKLINQILTRFNLYLMKNPNFNEEKRTHKYLKKTINKGLKKNKIALNNLFILFICVIFYATVKIVISLNFETEIKEDYEC